MIFSAQISMGSEIPNMGVQNSTNPSATTFGEALYLFYNGIGSDGIWYTFFINGVGWSEVRNAARTATGMGVSSGTSPSAVAFGDNIYLFYIGSGLDGIWYTTTLDGVTWTPVQHVPDTYTSQITSPYVMQFGEVLYLFYTDDNEGGIWCTGTTDGTGWSTPVNVAQTVTGMGVAFGTSPSAMAFGDNIYLFYVGSGLDGIWYTTSVDGGTWTPVQHVPESNVLTHGYMSANAAQLGNELFLFFDSDNEEGMWYTTSVDGVAWTPVISMQVGMEGGMGIMDGTSPSAVQYNSTLYVFWNGSGEDGIYYSYAIQI